MFLWDLFYAYHSNFRHRGSPIFVLPFYTTPTIRSRFHLKIIYRRWLSRFTDSPLSLFSSFGVIAEA